MLRGAGGDVRQRVVGRSSNAPRTARALLAAAVAELSAIKLPMTSRPVAPADDAVQHDVYFGHGARRVVRLKSPITICKHVVGGEGASGVLHRGPVTLYAGYPRQ